MSRETDKKPNTDEKRRKNRLYNIVMYVLAGVLMLGGIIIIINDQTYLFDKLGKWLSGEKTVMPTFPAYIPTLVPTDAYTLEPGTTPTEAPPVTETPEASESTGQTGSGWVNPNTPLPDPGPAAPAYVYFPQYNVSCPVDPVGYNWKGQMDTVRAYNRAGWLITSGTPVTGGNILIAGHNRYSGKLGYFSVIKDKLQIGDQIIVEMRSGNYAYYIVESINRWRYDEVPAEIMRLNSEPRLTLITCYGDYSSAIGSSIHRVIAVCRPAQLSQESNETPEPSVTEAINTTTLPLDTNAPATLPPSKYDGDAE